MTAAATAAASSWARSRQPAGLAGFSSRKLLQGLPRSTLAHSCASRLMLCGGGSSFSLLAQLQVKVDRGQPLDYTYTYFQRVEILANEMRLDSALPSCCRRVCNCFVGQAMLSFVCVVMSFVCAVVYQQVPSVVLATGCDSYYIVCVYITCTYVRICGFCFYVCIKLYHILITFVHQDTLGQHVCLSCCILVVEAVGCRMSLLLIFTCRI